ncbi:MAG TPA: hypothetical protein VGP93_19610, partial [Polyangiaceae bacterium]|nr:hypothetical protein [Polyangiaceae bacterium]
GLANGGKSGSAGQVSSGGSGTAGAAGSANAGSAGSAAGGSSAGGNGAQAGSNTGGTGGMHIASPCTALPASGTWEKISPTGDDASGSIALDPFDSAIIWAGNKNGLNKSTDCGASWTLVSTGTNGPGLANSSLWSIAVDPVEQGTIYLVGGYGALSLWKSTNSGVDWTNLFPADSEYATHAGYDFVNNVSMDPSDHLHLAVATHGSCSAPYDPNCDAETTDGGVTWTVSVAPSHWPEGGGLFVLDATTWLWCDPFGGIWRTQNNGGSFDKVWDGYGGNGEFTNHPLYPASDGAYYLSSIQGILRSTDSGATFTQVKNDGKFVGFAMSSTTLYAADQWSPSFATATISAPTTWTSFPAPPGLPDNQGAPYLEYDEDHHLLYASTWPGGLWRIVTP